MDDSLRSLINETQSNNEEGDYIINLNLDEGMRQKYSVLSLIGCLILNILLIVNLNYNIFLNIFLCIINNLFLLSPVVFSYKIKYNKVIRDNIVLLILLIISILFEFIICIEIDKNKLTLILIILIKNIILIYYILKVNNLLECNML